MKMVYALLDPRWRDQSDPPIAAFLQDADAKLGGGQIIGHHAVETRIDHRVAGGHDGVVIPIEQIAEIVHRGGPDDHSRDSTGFHHALQGARRRRHPVHVENVDRASLFPGLRAHSLEQQLAVGVLAPMQHGEILAVL